ncbi:MAG: ferritin-like domain-containing protein [Acidobacteriaceae bacterium]
MKNDEQDNATGVAESTFKSTFNRRAFVKGTGFASLGLAGAALVGSKFGSSEQKVEAASGVSDADILNFALNLEYLEAEFYLKATWNTSLVQLGIITTADQTGPTTGGAMVHDFQALPQAYVASALRTDEVRHVQYLRNALGAGAVKKPAINLNALGFGFANVNDWMKLASIFEDVGVSAYLGAAPLITNSTYLAAAAAIMGTEAQHSGTLREACIDAGVKVPSVDSLAVPPTAQNPYFVDKNGLSVPRTTMQVLNIVYASGQCSGGFYPNGMNGEIVCQS